LAGPRRGAVCSRCRSTMTQGNSCESHSLRQLALICW
jgi:hypothetical protein